MEFINFSYKLPCTSDRAVNIYVEIGKMSGPIDPERSALRLNICTDTFRVRDRYSRQHPRAYQY